MKPSRAEPKSGTLGQRITKCVVLGLRWIAGSRLIGGIFCTEHGCSASFKQAAHQWTRRRYQEKGEASNGEASQEPKTL